MMTRQSIPPVALFVFKRPLITGRVFAEIRRARPDKLLIVADGPRLGNEEEIALCAETRKVVSTIDWPCEVLTNFSNSNLGCKMRMASGLDWVFSNVEEAIILEDDCLPHPSFFRYCREMLDRYRDEERVMHIGGCNFQQGKVRGEGSYYFSRYNHAWGWAGWRRAWRHFDIHMGTFSSFVEEERIKTIFKNKRMQTFWLEYFRQAFENKVETWDIQWTFAIWDRDGLAITPNVNLVSNIGFGIDATNTTVPDARFMNLPTSSLGSIIHPVSIKEDSEADITTYRLINPSLLKRVFGLLKTRYFQTIKRLGWPR